MSGLIDSAYHLTDSPMEVVRHCGATAARTAFPLSGAYVCGERAWAHWIGSQDLPVCHLPSS